MLCQGKVSKMEDEAQSYWRATAKAFEPPPAELPSRTDVVVVGAGFTGVSAARVLAERELRSPFSMPKAWVGAHRHETAA